MHRENIYSCNLGADSREGEYSCVIKRKIRFLCIKFINKTLSSSLSRERRSSLSRTTLNCMFFFLYLLIFILCARDDRSHGVLEVVSEDLVSPNYWYHSKHDIQQREDHRTKKSLACGEWKSNAKACTIHKGAHSYVGIGSTFGMMFRMQVTPTISSKTSLTFPITLMVC